MKKTVCFVVSFFITLLILAPVQTSYAQEDCMRDPVYQTNWNAEVTTGARLRDIPCMTTSVVITTLPVGEIIKVIAETDGYYKIQRKDGTQGWVGQWLITATNKPFTADTTSSGNTTQTKEPLYDVTDHKNETQIRALYALKIVTGNPDGSFKPDSPLNRAELVKLLISATVTDFDTLKSQYNQNCFPDVTAGQWYTPYICYSKEKNIVKGYEDNTFKPARNISKAEAVKVILGSFGITVPSKATTDVFNDVSLTAWYAPYLQTAFEQLLLEEKNGENFNPETNILRGAVSYIIYQAYLYNSQTPTI